MNLHLIRILKSNVWHLITGQPKRSDLDCRDTGCGTNANCVQKPNRPTEYICKCREGTTGNPLQKCEGPGEYTFLSYLSHPPVISSICWCGKRGAFFYFLATELDTKTEYTHSSSLQSDFGDGLTLLPHLLQHYSCLCLTLTQIFC
jgi:hypothetical protein